MDLYRLFLRGLPCPIWAIDNNSKLVFLNHKYEEKFKIKSESVIGKTINDVLSVEESEIYNRQITKCLEIEDSYIEHYPKNERVISYYTTPIKNEEGTIVAVAGIIIDKTNEREVEQQKNILRTIIDSLPEAIFYKDRDSRFIGYNKNFGDFYKKRGISDIVGKTDLDIYSDRPGAIKFIEQDQEIIRTKEPKKFEYTRINYEGYERIEENIKVPVIDNEGNCWGIVGMSRDITERKKLEEKLRYVSEIDMLTGLYNRYSFEEKIKNLNLKQYHPLGIIMGDMNGLKVVNDTFGHLEGDKLLKDISRVLKKVCSEKGYVFRWGGDEFVILIPNCDESGCEGIVKQITNECKNTEYEFIQLSIALGATVRNAVDEDIYSCLKVVEDKLYRQKLIDKKSIKKSILKSIQESLEEKGIETNEHIERIVKHSLNIGKKLKFTQNELDELSLLARLHDIGEVGISEDILLKSGKLTQEEFDIVKTHSEKGYRILNESSELGNVAKSVLTHHESWDGNGYPFGLKEDEIPIMARIISVVDAYEAMINSKVYKKAINKEQALEELRRCANKQFDPKIVDIFIEYILGE